MNCQKIYENDYHEKYILGRLSKQEIAEYKEHLKICDSCRKELTRQQILIGSIREIGKQQMKKEIQWQVDQQSTKQYTFNWGMVLKVAAAILFFVIAPGMIYYYHTFGPSFNEKDKQYPQTEVEIESKIVKESIEPSEPVPVRGIQEKNNASKVKKQVEKQYIDRLASPKALPPKTFEKEQLPRDKSSPLQTIQPPPTEEAMTTDIVTETPLLQEDESGIPHVAKGMSVASSLGDREVGVAENTFSYKTDAPSSLMGADGYRRLYRDDGEEKRKRTSDKTWVFEAERKQIQVNLKLSEDNFSKEESLKMPIQFPVEVLKQDSMDVNMLWLVNSHFFAINPEEIIMQLKNADTLIVVAPKNLIYIINLRNRKSLANQQLQP